VAYDERLTDRIRRLIVSEPELTERPMFGGLAFLLQGNMAVAASGQGGLPVRVDPDQSDEFLATSAASAIKMRGRAMTGWLRVDSKHVATDGDLATWVERDISYARSLPPKR
jgi:hypothetical protein